VLRTNFFINLLFTPFATCPDNTAQYSFYRMVQQDINASGTLSENSNNFRYIDKVYAGKERSHIS